MHICYPPIGPRALPPTHHVANPFPYLHPAGGGRDGNFGDLTLVVQDDAQSFAAVRRLIAEVVPALRGLHTDCGLSAAAVLRPLLAALAAGHMPQHRRIPLFSVIVGALSSGGSGACFFSRARF